MMHDYQQPMSVRLLDQLEGRGAALTDEEVRYFLNCGFDNTARVADSNSMTKPVRRRGRNSNNIRRFFYAIGTSPQAAGKLCHQYGVSLNTVRQLRRFNSFPDRGRVRTRTIDGVLMIWREQMPPKSSPTCNA